MFRPVLAVVVALSAGCAATPPPATPQVAGAAVEFGRVRAAVEDVAASQATVETQVAAVLTGRRALDALVERLRDPAQVDDAVDDWTRVSGMVAAAEADGLRADLRAVAGAVDDARIAIARARSGDLEAWEADYLDAQDEVLTALRAHAAATDALVQVLGRSEATYTEVAGITGRFVERRWFFRSPQEAADAFEVDLSRHLAALRDARRATAARTAEADDTALAVNDATARAADIWGARPPAPPP